MKIGIDIRAASGEKAGKGWYTFHLTYNLLKVDKRNQYILYTDTGVPGFGEFKNAEQKVITGRGLLWHIHTSRDIKKENIDVFFAPTSYIVPALLSKQIKTVITVHDLVAFLFKNTHNKKAVSIEKMFLKRALKKAHFVCAVSENTKRDLVNKFKYDETKIGVVYAGADDNFKPVEKDSLAPFVEKTNLPRKFFLAVGTLEPRKNYPNLLKAFYEFIKIHKDYHLVIVGQKGWRYQEIYTLIDALRIKNRVHLLGYVSGTSLKNLYNLAEALVFPSFYEGFGIPPLEAMKCGCPVIVSHKSSLTEVVGDAGIYIDPESPGSITKAMGKIAFIPDLRENLIKQGFMQSKKFSWKLSAQKLLEILRHARR
ncbi:MAG: glycosyltransferase family 1 protein [Candidatus Gracilibacteria bacterium]|jgi:glycosyltransferase involved in cell wall biosynthesis